MTALRHRCRNTPRCGLKLPQPVENPHRAFCCKGCYTQFYRKRCLVCERSKAKPDGKINIKHPTCWRRACKAELRQYPHVFVRELPHIARAGLDEGSALSAGLKMASETGWSSTADGAKRIHLDDGRVFRVWGPTPTKRQIELWATPQDEKAAARLARTNALPEDLCRGGSGVPYNVVGGYRFPNPVRVEPDLLRYITETEARIGSLTQVARLTAPGAADGAAQNATPGVFSANERPGRATGAIPTYEHPKLLIS